jgi:hypothetical protein
MACIFAGLCCVISWYNNILCARIVATGYAVYLMYGADFLGAFAVIGTGFGQDMSYFGICMS